MNRYNDRFLPLLRQFLLIPKRNDKCMNLRTNCPTPCFNQFCWDLINTWWFVSFHLFSHLNLKRTWLRHYWFCYAYFCVPNITNSMYIPQLRETDPPPSQNNVGVRNQITLLILYYIISRLATLLEVTDAPIKVSDILGLTVSFKFINFSCQVLFLCVLVMSTRFSSYIV